MRRPIGRLTFAVLCAAAPLAGCDGFGTPNWAVYKEDAAHTPPPAVNLPAWDYEPYGPARPYRS